MSTENPTLAIDALLECSELPSSGYDVWPLTIARYALLELVESPYLNAGKGEILDLLPSLYIMTQTPAKLSAYTSRNIGQLKADAFEWSEQITPTQLPLLAAEVTAKVKQVNKLAPEVQSKSDEKHKGKALADG